MDEYDYYGKYNNKKIVTTNVVELQEKIKSKENNRKKIYLNILQLCYKKINSASEKDQPFCIYTLPEFIYGYPLYNMTECVLYILQNLNKNGFSCKYFNPYVIFITWNKKGNILQLEDKPNNVINSLNLNFKPTTDYKPTGNFIKSNKFSY